MSKYSFNKNYFDCIDTPEKAYWIGFIWCDGYCGRRERTLSHVEYTFKLVLTELDKLHLQKFMDVLDYTQEIKTGFAKTSKSSNKESRIDIYNKHFNKTLYCEYGLVPHRTETEKLLSSVPNDLHKDFIRGIFDADGFISFTEKERKSGRKAGKKYQELSMGFTTYLGLNEFIQQYFINNGLIKSPNKISYRSGDCWMLRWCGNRIGKNILNHLYEGSTVYLDRKFIKFKEISKQLQGEST